MAPHVFRQLIRFCVDAYGLERLFRLIQSIVHILASFSPLLLLVTNLSTGNKEAEVNGTATAGLDASAGTFAALIALKDQLGLIRKFFRTLRFLDAFNSAYNLAQQQAVGSMTLVMVLDIMAGTFNGIYLFLETATLIDAMRIEGLAVWSPENERLLKVESQRAWFLALILGGISCAVVLYQDQAERVLLSRLLQEEKQKKKGDTEKRKYEVSSQTPSKQDHVRRRNVELDRRRVALIRKLTANTLDLALPGSVIGWVPASSDVVGLCMLTTSLITGFDVWERYGRELLGAA